MLNKTYKEEVESRMNGQNIFAQSLAQSVRDLREEVKNVSYRLDSLQIEMADILISKATMENETQKKLDETNGKIGGLAEKTKNLQSDCWSEFRSLTNMVEKIEEMAKSKVDVKAFDEQNEANCKFICEVNDKVDKLYKHFNLTDGLVKDSKDS